MDEKFRNRFRIESARQRGWDYGRDGEYFLTICTLNRFPFFGYIYKQKMVLSDAGQMAMNIWNNIPSHFPFIELDEMIMMPDHVHGVLVVKKINEHDSSRQVEKIAGGFAGQQNPMLHSNIPRVVRWFKGRSTYEIRKSIPDFAWQSRYYDRVVRNLDELNFIRNYIRENPFNA